MCLSVAENLLPEVEVLRKIRLLSLIGRGMQFLDLGRHKEALLDFMHALQISPGKRLIFVRNRGDFHKFVLAALLSSAERSYPSDHTYLDVKDYSRATSKVTCLRCFSMAWSAHCPGEADQNYCQRSILEP